MRRKYIYFLAIFAVIFSLASCTDINQSGTGNNACANNADCGGSSAAQVSSEPAQGPSVQDSESSSTTSSQDSTPPTVSAEPQYSPVSLAALCSNTDNHFEYCSDGDTLKIGQDEYTFTTVAQVFTEMDGPLLSFSSTTCRGLSLRLAIGGSELPSELGITVSVTSQGTQSVTVNPGQLATLTADLTAGPFEIDASASLPPNGANSTGWELLLDGSASCSTSSGMLLLFR